MLRGCLAYIYLGIQVVQVKTSLTRICNQFIFLTGASQDLISNDDGTFFKRSLSIHKKVLEVFNNSSSYTAVPVRATILSGYPTKSQAMFSFQKWAIPGLFSVSSNINTFLQQLNVANDQSTSYLTLGFDLTTSWVRVSSLDQGFCPPQLNPEFH